MKVVAGQIGEGRWWKISIRSVKRSWSRVGIGVEFESEVVGSECRDQTCWTEVVWLERFRFLSAANRS
jgi:hypothetical protein